MTKAMSEVPFQVVITDFMVEPLEEERMELDGLAEVTALDAACEADLVGNIEQADALMVYHFLGLGRESIERLERCKIIVRPGVGCDNIDMAAARDCGIPVCNVPDYGTEEVADSALTMALSLLRGTHRLNHRLQRGLGAWSSEQVRPLTRIRGQVFGIVGCGRIGTAAALRAKAFGFQVVFYDPYLADGVDKALGVDRVYSLGELLEEADVLSLHCPLTEETRGMVGATEIAQMKNSAVLVNTARGGVADTAAVADALAAGKLAGAGIDVLETEPPADGDPVLVAWRDVDHPAHERLILNPHAAFYCEEGMLEFRRKGAAEVRRALLGEPLRNRVDEID